MSASLQLAWDDALTLAINGGSPLLRGENRAFRARTVAADLVEGDNHLLLTLSNTRGSNHGGWAFAFRCMTPEGEILLPEIA
jgi:hypothetical protein